jgi:hypothetical protein
MSEQILAIMTLPSKIVIVTTNSQYEMLSSHLKFNDVQDLLAEAEPDYPDWADLVPFFDVTSGLAQKTAGRVQIRDGEVFYDGAPLHNAVVSHLLRLHEAGSNLNAWILFLEQLMQNPSFRAREQLYGFMEASSIAIDQKGRLLLYKKVKSNYYDCYTGRTYLNTVGSRIEMPRTEVDDDPTRTCSAGLHVAAHSYLQHYTGDRVVICAVSPADVVAIPTDYNNAKMRVWAYEVVGEHKSALERETLTDPEYDTEDDFGWDEQEENDVDYYGSGR